MPTRPKLPKGRKKLKSSLAARRLIQAFLDGPPRRSERGAARALGLPNAAQMMKMLRGEIADTPAMQLAIARRKRLADAAWKKTYYMIREEPLTERDAKLTEARGLAGKLVKVIEEIEPCEK
jgi:hypothetical protein